MNRQLFISLITKPESITEDQANELIQMLDGHPYCQSAHILLAKFNHDKGKIDAPKYIRKAAIYTADRANLKYIIEEEKDSSNNHFKTLEQLPPTKVTSKNTFIEEITTVNKEKEELKDLEESSETKSNDLQEIHQSEETLNETKEAQEQVNKTEKEDKVINKTIQSNDWISAQISKAEKKAEKENEKQESNDNFDSLLDEIAQNLKKVKESKQSVKENEQETKIQNNDFTIDSLSDNKKEENFIKEEVVEEKQKPIISEPITQEVNIEKVEKEEVVIDKETLTSTNITKENSENNTVEQTETIEQKETVEPTNNTVENIPTINYQTEASQESIDNSIIELNLLPTLLPYRIEDEVVEEQQLDRINEELIAYLNWVNKKRAQYRKNKKTESEIIDKLIKEEPQITKLSAKDNQKPIEDLSKKSTESIKTPVSENYAKILVLQGKKEKAIEIYTELILKIPEKKAYFESQIEKLKHKL